VGIAVGVGVEILRRGRAQGVSFDARAAVGVVHSRHDLLGVLSWNIVSARGREVKRC
jgi:hypothetical protein